MPERTARKSAAASPVRFCGSLWTTTISRGPVKRLSSWTLPTTGLRCDRAKAALEQDEADLRGAEITVPPVNVQTSSQVVAAEAALKAAQDTEQQTRHTIDQLKSTRAATAADLAQAERDSKRFENLFTSGAGTERQHEQTRTTYERTKAQLSAIDSQIAALESALSASTQQVSRANAQLQSARSERSNVDVQQQKVESLKAKRDKSKAELEAAMLNLSYCTITAPITGYVAQKTIQVGDRIQPGAGAHGRRSLAARFTWKQISRRPSSPMSA